MRLTALGAVLIFAGLSSAAAACNRQRGNESTTAANGADTTNSSAATNSDQLGSDNASSTWGTGAAGSGNGQGWSKRMVCWFLRSGWSS